MIFGLISFLGRAMSKFKSIVSDSLANTGETIAKNPALFVIGSSTAVAIGYLCHRWIKYRVILEPIFDDDYGVRPTKILHTLVAGRVENENRGPNPADPPIKWIDPYFWMRDDKRNDPRVIAHLNRENSYFDHKTKHLRKLQTQLYNEFVSHTKETDTEVPYPYGEWFYYTRTVTGKPYKIHCRKPAIGGAPGGTEQILLDINELARGRSYCDVQGVQISPDHNKLAYTVDFTGCSAAPSLPPPSIHRRPVRTRTPP